MTIYEVISSPETADDDVQSPSLRGVARSRNDISWQGRLRGWLRSWTTTCADYLEAAALYDEFRGLSDAELARRGLDRATLGWDVCQACDRSRDRAAK